MGFSTKNTRSVERLYNSIEHSLKSLRIFRENRVEALKEYVGQHYSEEGSVDRVPLNMLELAVNIYVRSIAAREPKTMISTRHVPLKATASKFQLALDHLYQHEIDFGSTLRAAATDAMFTFAVIKVGQTPAGTVEVGGYRHDVLQPYADTVDLDDWVHDVTARKLEECQFCGNRYRLPLDTALDSGLYDNKRLEMLAKQDRFDHTSGTVGGEERAEELSRGRSSADYEYEEFVELWDLWLPRENLLITLPDVTGPRLMPVRTVEWDGPECGPYHMLGFNTVPNNIVPLSPVMILKDLHDLSNRLFRKLARQAERQKTLTFARTGAEKDGNRVKNASDGEMISVDDPNGVKEVRYGGVDQLNLSFMFTAIDRCSYHAGNLESMGGLAPQAGTLGQEQILANASSVRVQDMRDAMIKFTREVTRSVGYYLYNDPLLDLPLTKRVPGSDVEVPIRFSPEDREADFYEYNLDIHPYSMQAQMPEMQLQKLMQIMTQVVLPNMEFIHSQGHMVNFEGFLRKVAELSDMPHIDELITFGGPPQDFQPGPVGRDPRSRQAANTTRTNVRVNGGPGGGGGSPMERLAKLMMGSGTQQASAAAMGGAA